MTEDEKVAIEYAEKQYYTAEEQSPVVYKANFERCKHAFLAGRKGEARRGAEKMLKFIRKEADNFSLSVNVNWDAWEKEEA